MKNWICVVLAVVLCLGCTGCSSSPAEDPIVATETTEETQPEETVPVLAEPADQLPKKPRYNFTFWDQEGNETDNLQIYECRMYPTDNDTTIFAIDYKTVEGLGMIIYGYADDGNNDPNYWEEIELLTTGEETTFIFEVENEVLDLIYHVGILFRDQYGFDTAIIEIFHRNEDIYTTSGNPVGEAEPLIFTREGNITIHNATIQHLDNGYVRFTLECTPRKDLYYCFYTDSDENGEQIACYGGLTSGKKEIIVADLWAEDIAGQHNFTFSFYKAGEYPDSRAYLYSTTTNFDELVPYNFAGFIDGTGKFTLLYYGVLDEAVLGATLTAGDGSSVVVTEKQLSKNGEGCSLVSFAEFKAKRQDAVSVTLSKEGYEDINLELLVH